MSTAWLFVYIYVYVYSMYIYIYIYIHIYSMYIHIYVMNDICHSSHPQLASKNNGEFHSFASWDRAELISPPRIDWPSTLW